MAQTVCVILTEDEKARLRAISEDRSRPLKHVQRARIVLLSSERLSVLEVAYQAGVSRTAVWRWQQRFAEEGVDGLLRDKTRPPSAGPLYKGTAISLTRAVGVSPLKPSERNIPKSRGEPQSRFAL